ncbi:unnamed protein product [Closterium sp. Yama58-4]|nr:unnamed protein product [Closterium sp. Yama58-4]
MSVDRVDLLDTSNVEVENGSLERLRALFAEYQATKGGDSAAQRNEFPSAGNDNAVQQRGSQGAVISYKDDHGAGVRITVSGNSTGLTFDSAGAASTTNLQQILALDSIVSHGVENGGVGSASISIPACGGDSDTVLVASGTGDSDGSYLSGIPQATLNEPESPAFSEAETPTRHDRISSTTIIAIDRRRFTLCGAASFSSNAAGGIDSFQSRGQPKAFEEKEIRDKAEG